MKTKLFAFLIFFLWTLPSFAQYVDTAWVRRYNGPENGSDKANALAIDDSGNIYVTGQSYGGVASDDDYVTIKYYPNGDTAWVRRYNGPENLGEWAYAIAVDDSENVYVTGRSWADNDYLTIKYYPNGDTAWVRKYNGPGNSIDYSLDIAVDSSRNVYVIGRSYGSGTAKDYATIKYYPNGDTAWVRRYNGPGNSHDDGIAIAVYDSGNVYVTGYSFGSGTGYDYATIKYYANGDTAWVRRYNGPGDSTDWAYAIAVGDSGNVYVTGRSYGSGTDEDYATIKYYPNGDTAWVRRYNRPGNGDDYAEAITTDSSGNVYVTGGSGWAALGYDYATIKYHPNGDTAWVRIYNGPADLFDVAHSMAVDGLGNVYVTGESYDSETERDYVTIKYYPNGDIAWLRRYNGPGNSVDVAYTVTVDNPGNVYVTGYSGGSGTYEDYAIIKYFQYDSIPFAPAVNYWAGDSPRSVFCVDLDNDTDLDLAIAAPDYDKVYILKNNGNGTFQSGVDYSAGNGPYSVFCADLDGDADLDLAVADYYGDCVSILRNNGNGTFQSPVSYGAGDGSYSVFCADLDGDADLDLAVANWNSNNVSILKNKGDGTFQTKVNYGAGSGPQSVFCADLDGDGDLDLAVSNVSSHNLSILRNNGNGTFQSAVNYGVGNAPRSVFCADLDGDADLDLAVANDYNSNDVSILKNVGNGTFQSAVNYGVGGSAYCIFCADLDGDGDLDLGVANQGDYNVSILKNNGDATFQSTFNYGVWSIADCVFCADLDGDGDLDLAVVSSYSDTVSIFENLTQLPANQPPWAFSLISPPDGDTTLAFDSLTFRWQIPYDPNFGDHIRYDLYVSTEPTFDPDFTVIHDSLPLSRFTDTLGENTYYWRVKAYDNWGAETWSSETWSFTSHADSIPFAPAVNYATGHIPHSVFCADLDSDGDLDLAVGNTGDGSHNVSILLNNGEGTFLPAVNFATGHSHSVFCADLDGDGDLDLAVANHEEGNVSILLNYGNGTFQGAVDYGTGAGAQSVFCADLDGDGHLDLAVANVSSANVSILKNNGDGTFQPKVDYGASWGAHSVFCADLDGDGDLDLAVANWDDNNVSILKNNGNGTFQNAVNYGVANMPDNAFCGDLDGDTDLDLAVAIYGIGGGGNTVAILKNDGAGTFQTPVYYGVENGPMQVFCADLDGDLDLDLAVSNSFSDNVSILKNNGDGTFQSAVSYGVGDNPHQVFCADLDGDGDFDLAVGNYDDDSVSILKNLTQVPANQPPWAFSLISPTAGDTSYNGSMTFRWRMPYDPNFGDQIRYDLYVSTDPFFTPDSTTIYDSLTISRFSDTLGINTYYWKVRAYDNWSAERWSTQTWSFDVAYLTDTLWVYAFSPVDLIVTDPMGNFIRLDSNTILGATYDTSTDYNHDGDNDDIVTIPNRLAGDYTIEVVAEPGGGGGVYSIGIRIDGTQLYSLATNNSAPPPGEVDTFSYNVPVCFNGDLTGDMQIALGDVVYLITFLYKNGPAPNPLELADVNSNGVVDLGDLVYLISYQYKGGPKPPCWQ
jgi:hypothetical protein